MTSTPKTAKDILYRVFWDGRDFGIGCYRVPPDSVDEALAALRQIMPKTREDEYDFVSETHTNPAWLSGWNACLKEVMAVLGGGENSHPSERRKG